MNRTHTGKTFFILLSLVAVMQILPGCASTPQGKTPAAEGQSAIELTDVLTDEALLPAHVGIHVISVERNDILFSYNAQKRFIPASNMKLFTSAAGIALLSPDFTYETLLIRNGTVTSGILQGDLIIIGAGDPTISGYFHGGNARKVFDDWSATIKQAGIRSVSGNIVIDNSTFRTAPLGQGWSWDDEMFCFSARNDAFSFNNNCVNITVDPGETKGRPARITVEPGYGNLTVLNRATTGDSAEQQDIRIERILSSHSIVVSGIIPASGNPYRTAVAIEKPACYAGFILREVLANNGVTCTGGIRCDLPPQDIAYRQGVLLSSHRSPRLSEIIQVINKKSSNFVAEQLFLTIGKIHKGEGNPLTAAATMKEWLGKAGIDKDNIQIADGSGLSRYNLVTPETTVSLLVYMSRHDGFNPFYDSLAIAGTDGTLKTRLMSPPLRGNLRGKTGTMNSVRNLSGYVTTKDGERLAFSIMVNNFSADPSVIEGLIERICLKLATFSRKGTGF